MNIVTIIKIYLTINLLVALSSIVLFGLQKIGRSFTKKLTFHYILKTSYLLVGMSLILPFAPFSSRSSKIWAPTAQVWTAFHAKNVVPSSGGENPTLALSIGQTNTPLASNSLTYSLVGLLICGWLLVGHRVIRDARILFTMIRTSFQLKKIGRVSILAIEEPIIPFSVWMPFKAFVVLPQTVISTHEKYSMIVKHELQHHRQQDTKWIYVLQFIGALCFWNPFAYFLQKQIGDLQEVACDEYLIGHQRTSSKAYCECLLWVAQNTMQSRTLLVGTAGFARGSAAKLLKRRVEEMFAKKSERISKAMAMGISTLTLGFLTAATAATHSVVQDRRITMSMAETMAKAVDSEKFPVLVNDLVLDQLNKFLGTPDGREFMRGSLERMKAYEAHITNALMTAQLPVELLAVPVIESGYRNLPANGKMGHGAGLWMFIRQTARNYGLRVDDTVDERLNITKETGAAVKAFTALYEDFDDWGLALLGYNAGENAVRKAIKETGSRDVWKLIRSGHENDPHYVAAVMAAVLILKNPSYLE